MSSESSVHSQAVPSVQKAWIVEHRGKPSHALKLKSDHPVSKLDQGDVLVKVQAAALNPVGYKMMKLLPNFLAKRPLIAENDLAGTIVDANGTEFSNGDQVFGYISVEVSRRTGQGALAEYVRVPADHLVIRPPNITPTEAAGLTLAGQTAYQALFNDAKLESGQTVFINGGSTAVGLFAIQIAKANGTKVVASASGKNEEFLKSLGIDEFIDYTRAPLHQHLTSNSPTPKFHAIIDAVGLSDPSLYIHSPTYLAPGGIFITTDPSPRSTSWTELSNGFRTLLEVALRPTWLGGVNRTYKLTRLANKKEHLNALQSLVAQGKVKSVVDSVFSFEDALKAYERIMTSRAKGKIVVKVEDNVD